MKKLERQSLKKSRFPRFSSSNRGIFDSQKFFFSLHYPRDYVHISISVGIPPFLKEHNWFHLTAFVFLFNHLYLFLFFFFCWFLFIMPVDKVYLFKDCKLGPDAELGHKLIRGFLKNLSIAEDVPKCMFFSNEGAKLVFTDDETLLEPLRKLQERGVDIAVCNTCIQFYNFDGSKIPVGRIGTAPEFVKWTLTLDVVTVC